MTAADELLKGQDEVRPVLCLDEAVVVVDEVLRVIERDTNNRVADDLVRRPTERLAVTEVDRAPGQDVEGIQDLVAISSGPLPSAAVAILMDGPITHQQRSGTSTT